MRITFVPQNVKTALKQWKHAFGGRQTKLLNTQAHMLVFAPVGLFSHKMDQTGVV